MRRKNKQVYVIGNEKIEWSIKQDRKNTILAIKKAGFEISKNIIRTDIIYCVYWNKLDNIKFRIFNFFFPRKKIVAVLTNDLTHQKEVLNRVKPIVNYWICANSKQKKILLETKIQQDQIFYNPFFVDPRTFYPHNNSRNKLSKIFKFDEEKIKGKFLIGSFQRDSLGKDLQKAKWQKNPDLLLSTLSEIDPNKYVLILAGPRRHYIIGKCISLKIPYLYLGNVASINRLEDDITINTLPLNIMNLLYNFVDLNIMTSSSEGGPKSIMESILTKTPILATDVGFVKDLLDPALICSSKLEFVHKINKLIEYPNFLNNPINQNYQKVLEINMKYQHRISNILTQCL